MVKLTKLNGEQIIINSSQIESIEVIPESKIILINKNFYIVKENTDDIIKKVIEYSAKVHTLQRDILVINNVDDCNG